MNIAIIGAGAVGSAAARFLAQAAHRVTVLEQFTLDHDRGSSFGASRLIRRTYPDALYTRMMATAYELWADLERQSGQELFVRCGGLTFGCHDNPTMADTEEALRVNGVPFERLSADEVRERFPPLRLDDGQYAIWQSDSGFLRASRCVRAQMQLALIAGAHLRENARVQDIRSVAADRVRITLSDGPEDFDRVLVTVGSWMGALLPELRLPLVVTRQYYAHLEPQNDAQAFDRGTFPVWIDADTNFYGFPSDGETPGVKIAWHERGQAMHPDQTRRVPDEKDRRPLLDYAVQRLPDLSKTIVSEKTCLYTNTPDEDFIVDAIPGLPGGFLCSGCSGHGFKFSIFLGRILADFAVNRPSEHELARFRLSRFG